jgi:hypothetical protein
MDILRLFFIEIVIHSKQVFHDIGHHL